MDILQFFDYFGVFVFAISGALLAARKQMDIFGFLVLSLMPAIGGGTLRDLILDQPVFWLSDTAYLFITFSAALLTFSFVRFVSSLVNIVRWSKIQSRLTKKSGTLKKNVDFKLIRFFQNIVHWSKVQSIKFN